MKDYKDVSIDQSINHSKSIDVFTYLLLLLVIDVCQMIRKNRPINIRHNAINSIHSAHEDVVDDRKNVFVVMPRKSLEIKFRYLVRTRLTNGR